MPIKLSFKYRDYDILCMNFCPCLKNLLTKLKGKEGKASYEGPREFEEEEFMNPHHDEPSLSDTIPHKVQPHGKKPQLKVETKPIIIKQEPLPRYEEQQPQTQILNIKLDMPNTELVSISPSVGQKEEQSIQQLIEAELLLTPSDVIKQDAFQREQIKLNPMVMQEDFTEQPTFTVNLDPLDPYFSLIHEKATLVPQLLRSQGQRLQIGSPNKTGLEIFLVENPKASSFVFRYSLNCSYSFYLSVLRAEKVLVSFGGFLAESKTLESYRPNLTLSTLKFKRLGVFEARDCYYVKYQNGSKRHHWELYLNDQQTPRSPDYKNCEIFCCKSFKQEGERELRVTEYVEVDLGASNLSNIIPKLAVETRNFLNSLNEHLERNCEQELA